MIFMIFYRKSGIFLYSPGNFTNFRGILIQKPVFMDISDWIEH